MPFKKDIKLIWSCLDGYQKKLSVISLVAVLSSLVSAIIPFLYGKLVDYALDLEKSVWLIFYILLGWLILSVIGDWAQRSVENNGRILTEEVGNNFAYKIFSHAFELPLAFHLEKKKG